MGRSHIIINDHVFTVDSTSRGFLIQCEDIPEIILEIDESDDVVAKVEAALECYYESFGDHSKT